MSESYGIRERWEGGGINLEELAKIGFTVVEGVFTEEEMSDLVAESENLLMGQTNSGSIPENEKNMLRSPLVKSKVFRDIAIRISELEIVTGGLGTDIVQLQLQNGIKVEPRKSHHQSSWHRDLPYQHWISTVPLSISVLLAVTPFRAETGATQMIPHSHKSPGFPSEEYADKHNTSLEARPGSILVFDSMVYHRAGHNSSGEARWAINHIFTPPFIKQQISLSTDIRSEGLSERELVLFGHKYQTPSSLEDFYRR